MGVGREMGEFIDTETRNYVCTTSLFPTVNLAELEFSLLFKTQQHYRREIMINVLTMYSFTTEIVILL